MSDKECSKCAPKRNRRAHKKSRAGCQNCKRRKVKCDEVKPACGNCIRFSMACDFSLTTDALGITSLPSRTVLAGPPEKRSRGRPRRTWQPITRPKSDSQGRGSSNSAPSPALGTVETQPFGLPANTIYLDLMHTWTIYTGPTCGAREIWCVKIPPLSFQHPYLLHIILALAAQHSARLKPDEAERYMAIAEEHGAIAVKEATVLLPHLNRDNAQPMYATTMLICLCSFAKGPSNGDLLITADHGRVAWVALLGGVRFIIETLGPEAIFHGIFVTRSEEPDLEVDKKEVAQPFINSWQKALEKLRRLIRQADEAHASPYLQHLESLIMCYDATYGTNHDPKTWVEGKFENIVAWLYNMDMEFIERLRAKEAIPLLLLAYFAVLLKSLQTFWFMEGWHTHIIGEVARLLDAQYREFLEWPMAQIAALDETTSA